MRPRCGLMVKDSISLKNRHMTEEIALPLSVTEMLHVIYKTLHQEATHYRELTREKSPSIKERKSWATENI